MSNHFTTDCIHGDDYLNRVSDVVTPINVSTTFRYDNENLVPAAELGGDNWPEGSPIYSRLSHPNAERLEAVLKKILGGPSVVYASGLSAYFAILTHCNPKKIFQAECYHGCQAAAAVFSRIGGTKICSLADVDDLCEPGDLVHIEDPCNPYGECVDLNDFSSRVHQKGGILLIDSTLAPPPLRNPWDYGADIIMHSGTKYLGGHSDLLSGVLCVKEEKIAQQLRSDRVFLGTIPASLESFLLLRSLRSLEVRVLKQSDNGTELVRYLNDHISDYDSVLDKIYHASLQKEEYVKKQMSKGYGPLFSIVLKNKEQCKKLVKNVHIFQHATSLGGAESLIEWRAMSDAHADQRLLRVSVGLENVEDLIEDLAGTLRKIQSGEL